MAIRTKSEGSAFTWPLLIVSEDGEKLFSLGEGYFNGIFSTLSQMRPEDPAHYDVTADASVNVALNEINERINAIVLALQTGFNTV